MFTLTRASLIHNLVWPLEPSHLHHMASVSSQWNPEQVISKFPRYSLQTCAVPHLGCG